MAYVDHGFAPSAFAAYNALNFELGTRNLAALVANFHKADEQLQHDLRVLASDYAEHTKELTRSYAPKDTHFMEEHVRVFMSESGLVWEVGWDASDFIEAGEAFYPWFQEFGTRSMNAQPSLGPASEQVFPVYRDAISDLVRESIDRLRRA